jgi:hypothetical protein
MALPATRYRYEQNHLAPRGLGTLLRILEVPSANLLTPADVLSESTEDR